MYLKDFLAVPMSLAGHPRHLHPERAVARGCPSASSSPGPAFSENALLDAAHALERAIDFRDAPWRARA